jgi:hypothetical protein
LPHLLAQLQETLLQLVVEKALLIAQILLLQVDQVVVAVVKQLMVIRVVQVHRGKEILAVME